MLAGVAQADHAAALKKIPIIAAGIQAKPSSLIGLIDNRPGTGSVNL